MTTVCNGDVREYVDELSGGDVSISTTHSINDYFRTAVCEAVRQEQIALSEDTLWYLTQLFSNYHRTDRLFDFNAERSGSATRPLTPLADYYRMAVESDSDKERRLYLQKLGDVAIFISSLYAGALKRKPVGVAYYISMGESAYGSLADAPATTSRHRALAGVFDELSHEFASLVPALGRLGKQDAGEHLKAKQPTTGIGFSDNSIDSNASPTLTPDNTDCGLIIPGKSMLH